MGKEGAQVIATVLLVALACLPAYLLYKEARARRRYARALVSIAVLHAMKEGIPATVLALYYMNSRRLSRESRTIVRSYLGAVYGAEKASDLLNPRLGEWDV